MVSRHHLVDGKVPRRFLGASWCLGNTCQVPRYKTLVPRYRPCSWRDTITSIYCKYSGSLSQVKSQRVTYAACGETFAPEEKSGQVNGWHTLLQSMDSVQS
jgi:hypothetical protein